MSWESVASHNLISLPASHKLSATRLLASPDGSRHPLDNAAADVCHLDDSFSRLAGYESSPDTSLWNRTGFQNHSRYSMLDCFFACHKRIKQYLAKRKIQRGMRLYEQHNQVAAVRMWQSALKSTTKRDDRFQLLGYLYQGHMDWGKYREAVEYGHKQLGISEELDSPGMRAEAYLNLARTHERLGGLERALSYARHSLYNECGTQCRSGGLTHLTVARVYLEMGGFSRALEGLQAAHKIAAGIGDPALQLQVYVSLSELFGRLQDAEKSARYASKAYDLSRSLQLGDLNTSHHRAALLRMAASLRKQGDLGDAHDYCTEATRLSVVSGDQATFTRSIRIMGDIYRKKQDIDRAFCHYQQAMGIAAALGDRMAQMEAMDGQARCLEALRTQGRICNCRPLEFNTRLLEVASSVGAKLLVRKIRARLALIYRSLGDEDQYATHSRLATQADLALGLHCGACNEVFGIEPNALEVLSCSHILHYRCARDLYRRRDKSVPGSGRSCPACNKLVASRSRLCEDDDDDDGGDDGGGGGGGDDGQLDGGALSIMCDGGKSLAMALAAHQQQQQQQQQHQHHPDGLPQKYVVRRSAAALSSTLPLMGANGPRSVHRSNLSLASLNLRASSLTINSECNATSSV